MPPTVVKWCSVVQLFFLRLNVPVRKEEQTVLIQMFITTVNVIFRQSKTKPKPPKKNNKRKGQEAAVKWLSGFITASFADSSPSVFHTVSGIGTGSTSNLGDTVVARQLLSGHRGGVLKEDFTSCHLLSSFSWLQVANCQALSGLLKDVHASPSLKVWGPHAPSPPLPQPPASIAYGMWRSLVKHICLVYISTAPAWSLLVDDQRNR